MEKDHFSADNVGGSNGKEVSFSPDGGEISLNDTRLAYDTKIIAIHPNELNRVGRVLDDTKNFKFTFVNYVVLGFHDWQMINNHESACRIGNPRCAYICRQTQD